MGNFFIFKNTAQSKQSPNRRQFDQSGHPDHREKKCPALEAEKVAKPSLESILRLLNLELRVCTHNTGVVEG
jgi:hypothetical protein